MGHFSIQIITALIDVVTGGSGSPSKKTIGVYRKGSELELFLGAAGLELHIGGNSRVPAVREVIINANKDNPDAVIKLIKQVADPREYLSCPEKCNAVVEYLNARLRGDGYELKQINGVYELCQFSSDTIAASKEEIAVIQKPERTNHIKEISSNNRAINDKKDSTKIEQKTDGKRENREGEIEGKPPEFIQHYVWYKKYWKKYWGLILIAIMFFLGGSIFVFPQIDLFKKTEGPQINIIQKPGVDPKITYDIFRTLVIGQKRKVLNLVDRRLAKQELSNSEKGLYHGVKTSIDGIGKKLERRD